MTEMTMPDLYENSHIDPAYYRDDAIEPAWRRAPVMTIEQNRLACKHTHDEKRSHRDGPTDARIGAAGGGHQRSAPAACSAEAGTHRQDAPADPPGGHVGKAPPRKRLKHVDRYIDKNGIARHYYRRGHGRRIALVGMPGTPEFEASYQAAAFVAREAFLRKIKRDAEAGTVGLLVRHYLESAILDHLSTAARRAHARVLSGWVAADQLETRQVAALGPKAIRAMMARRAATPAAANDLLRKVSGLMQFAVERRWRKTDPMRSVAPFPRGEGRRAWTTAELAAFEARWPIATTAGKALVLLVMTRKGPQNIVALTTSELDDALRGALRIELAAPPDAFVLTTARGKPFTAHGFVNFFAAAVRAAGLPPDCVAGGLRKSREPFVPIAQASRAASGQPAVGTSTQNKRSQAHVPA
jgi:hypothetical protein